jgi:hypothetical protein
MDDDKLPLDAAFMAGMKPSQRKTLAQALTPAEPQDFDWESQQSDMTTGLVGSACVRFGMIDPVEQKSD